MDSLISFLWSIVRFIIMILLSYLLDGLIYLFGGFGHAKWTLWAVWIVVSECWRDSGESLCCAEFNHVIKSHV